MTPPAWKLPNLPYPTVADTRLGPVEYAVFGSGPAVLCLHGAMGGYDQSALLALAAGPAGFQYIAVSRPGYLGTPLGENASPQGQADLCAALLDKLAIERAAVMAVSGGGPCALSFGLGHTDRCRGLVLLSTCAGRIEAPVPLGFRVMLRLVGLPLLAGLMARKKPDPTQAARRSVTDAALRDAMLADPDTAGLFAALVASTSDRLDRRVPGARNDIAVTRKTDYPLEDIAVPTLIVHGRRDPHVPYEAHGARLATCIPGARLAAVEGGEHACLFTHRVMIRQEVDVFLGSLPA